MGKGKKKEPINLGHHEKLLTFATRISNGTGRFQSGQMGQTVNLLLYSFGGSNPSLPTKQNCGSSSVDRASAFQAKGREFEPRLPLK